MDRVGAKNDSHTKEVSTENERYCPFDSPENVPRPYTYII